MSLPETIAKQTDARPPVAIGHELESELGVGA